MTAIRRDGNDSPFSDWIRNEPRLDSIKNRLCVTDVDYWIHQYRSHTDTIGDRLIDSIMAIELKTFASKLKSSQRDTLSLVKAGMRKAFYDKKGNVKTLNIDTGNEIRKVRVYGYFMLRLHKDRPDNSQWIEWHGRRIDADMLVQILNFDIDPRTLKSRSDRRHHLASKMQSHPDMFDFEEE